MPTILLGFLKKTLDVGYLFTASAVAVWCWNSEQQLAGAGVASGQEEIPHIQGQEQWLCFAGAVMKPGYNIVTTNFEFCLFFFFFMSNVRLFI